MELGPLEMAENKLGFDGELFHPEISGEMGPQLVLRWLASGLQPQYTPLKSIGYNPRNY